MPAGSVSVNPFAPPVYNGVQDASPSGFRDIDFTYVFDIVLTALEAVRDQQVAIHTDSDFVWRGTIAARATGAFLYRFYDSQGYYQSSGMVHSANLSANPAEPTPQFPQVILPAGGRIGIDLTDLSNAQNTIQIVFRGVKRYRSS